MAMKTVQWKTFSAIGIAVLLALAFTCTEQSRSAESTLLAAPRWEIGDWFELKISHWRGYAIAALPGNIEWSSPIIKHYEVVGEEMVFGFPCFVVAETWQQDGRSVEGDKYLFRKSDWVLVSVKLNINIDKGKWMMEYGESPWIIGDLGLVPRFPVAEGIKVFPPAEFIDASGKPVKPRSEAESWQRPVKKPQGSCRDRITHKKKTHDIVQIEYSGYVCRWVPGQLWWAQCWQEPTRAPGSAGRAGKKAAFYRAALYATSRDGILDYPLPKAAKGGLTLEERIPCLPRDDYDNP